MKINNSNKTIKLINDGEINILKTPGLTDIDFECEIPQQQYPYAVYKNKFQKASYFLNYFEKLKKNKKPFQFIVCRRFPNGKKLFYTNLKVSLEEYRITEDAGNGFDESHVAISLVLYSAERDTIYLWKIYRGVFFEIRGKCSTFMPIMKI